MICRALVLSAVFFSLCSHSFAQADGAAKKGEAVPVTVAASGNVSLLTISGPVFEAEPPLNFFGGAMGASLADVTAAIRKAKTDPKTSALILKLNAPTIGWTQAQAIRRELIDYRKSGKTSHCFLKFGSTGTYLLASACSEVSMVPSGILEIPGVGMGRMYLKDLFDLVGVEFQELRMGRYKSAVEGYTRSGPSDPVREETHALLDELYSELIDSIAENRDMKAVDVRSLIDTAMFLPEEAKERGLIDHIEYGDQFQERVAQKRKIVAAPMGKKLNLQVGGFAGMMTLFNELFAGPKRTFATKKPKLAIVSASGQIMESSQPSLMGGAIISSSSMVKTLRGLYEDDTVKAVVLRVNSPGGSALASDLIWRELELLRTKKPVVVSMGDLAASGGYYISCNAHWIVAERGTLTGSIGVIGAVPNFRKIGERVGVKFETFSRGKRNGMISPYGEISKDGRDSMMRFLHKIYDDFVSKVAKGRKLDKKAVHSIAEGRVWTGGQALEIGLVDELGGVDVAIAKAKSLASLDDKVEVLRLPKAKTLFEVLNDLEGASLSTTVTKGAIRSLGASLPKEIREALAGFEWLGQIDRKQAFLLSPHLWTIR